MRDLGRELNSASGQGVQQVPVSAGHTTGAAPGDGQRRAAHSLSFIGVTCKQREQNLQGLWSYFVGYLKKLPICHLSVSVLYS